MACSSTPAEPRARSVDPSAISNADIVLRVDPQRADERPETASRADTGCALNVVDSTMEIGNGGATTSSKVSSRRTIERWSRTRHRASLRLKPVSTRALRGASRYASRTFSRTRGAIQASGRPLRRAATALPVWIRRIPWFPSDRASRRSSLAFRLPPECSTTAGRSVHGFRADSRIKDSACEMEAGGIRSQATSLT